MVTLQELQTRLDTELQNTLKGVQPNLKNQDYVKMILWDRIKYMLTQIADFNGFSSEDMRRHIYKWLNEQGLHGTAPTRIILSNLKGWPAPDPVQVYQTYQWLAY
jgi:hypothetical protein